MSQNTKEIIRQQMGAFRKALSLEEQLLATARIIQNILSLSVYHHCKRIGLYQASNHEADLSYFWHHASHEGIITAFPSISQDKNNKIMRFLEADPLLENDFIPNRFQILEPGADATVIDIETMDCLFIPLFAFDSAGYRLGHGQGYYDQTLQACPKEKRPLCIGIGYDFQRVDTLPHDTWDIPLDMVITEKEVYSFHSTIFE